MACAIIFARFSPRKDSDTSVSNETQIAQCHEYCTKFGHEVVEVFQEDAISGKHKHQSRVGLRNAIAALKRGYVLVAYSSSRLARRVLVLEDIYDRVATRKASVELVEDGGRVSTDPIDVCMRQVRAAFDEYDRKMIGKRTKDAMLRHIADGRAFGKEAPYGKKEGPAREIGGELRRTWVDDDAEQAVIGRIMEMREEGMGLREIARWLDESAVPCRSGGDWNHVTIARIVRRAGDLPKLVAQDRS